MSESGDARVEAARAITRVLRDGAALDAQWPAADARLADPRDRGLARAIAYAALRGIHRYEALLAQLLQKPLPPREAEVHALLVCGLAQLEQAITPGYAAVSGSVAAARALGRPKHAALVNALLRRYQRERDALERALPDTAAVRYNHPAWLVAALRAAWPDAWEAVLAAGNAPAPLWLRVNRRRASIEEYAATLAASGLAPTRHPLLPDGLCLAPAPDLATLPGLAEGHISVQDGAAQLAVELLALAPGLRVLDACAAPGGKSAHLLEREPALAMLLALDDKPARVARVRETLARLGLAAEVREGDATAPAGWWDGKPWDRILVDAPCSGTGVIRRHPDIRLLRRADDLAGLTALQDRLLDALWPLLAPGGRLVYATCSVLPAENDERIAAFLARTPAAVAVDAVPQGFGRPCAHGRQNLSGVDGMDGFYYAVLAHRA
ncbi:MAG: 16S rRNA (cytosine(967)-C(5))-methyltransferase RsmB [Xanthomonadales bacterium]|nr:16S rRNA (cytosine(967)-C(5))-methyltransferase RsmB [Xanthomonadales bacterium]